MADEMMDVTPRYQNPDAPVTKAATSNSEGLLAYLSTHWIGVSLVLVLVIICIGAAILFCRDDTLTKKKIEKPPDGAQQSAQTQNTQSAQTQNTQSAQTQNTQTTQTQNTQSAQTQNTQTTQTQNTQTTQVSQQQAAQTQAQPAVVQTSKSELDAILKAAQNVDSSTLELMDDGTEELVGRRTLCVCVTASGRKCGNIAVQDNKCQIHLTESS